MSHLKKEKVIKVKRDNLWLKKRLRYLWHKHFSDVRVKNTVMIKFGRPNRTRFGSIRLDKAKNTKITINGFFKNPLVPLSVIDITLAHEVIHYAHGFYSPHPRLYRYPHQGGIVNKELQKRGLGLELGQQKRWLKITWPKIIKQYFPKRRRYGKRLSLLPNYFR